MRFILLEKLRQEIAQKRNQLLLLLSSFPNYYKPFRGFEDLISMVFNIFWSLFLLLSNFVFFFSSLIEDLKFDFNLITNIFLDSVLFLGTIIMLISMMISTLISLPLNLLWSHSVTENTEIQDQSYSQILKNLFEQKPVPQNPSVRKLVFNKIQEFNTFEQVIKADLETIEIKMHEIYESLNNISSLLPRVSSQSSQSGSEKKEEKLSDASRYFDELYTNYLKLSNNYPDWEELPDEIYRTNPEYVLQRITKDLDVRKIHHAKVIDKGASLLELYQQMVNDLETLAISCLKDAPRRNSLTSSPV